MKFSKKKGLISFGVLSIIIAIVLLVLDFTIWKDTKNFKNVIAAVLLVAFVGIINILLGVFDQATDNKKIITTKMISMVGVMSAISCILYIFVKFKLPFFPTFLDIQVSEIPALIAGYAYGPVAGCLVILIRCLVKLPLSSTAMVGELADLIVGLVLVIISSLIYRKHKNFKGALIGFIISATVATGVAMLANWLVLIPFYINFYFNGSIQPLLGMLSMIPGVNESNYMVLYLFAGNLPFNVFRYILVGILTFILYKRIHILIDRIVNK